MSTELPTEAFATTKEDLEQFGMIGVAGGIQVDINAARKKISNGQYQDAAWCDHNCRTTTDGQETGHYDCPAAFTLNKGVEPKTLASVALLLQGIETTAEGLRQFNQIFLEEGGFDQYTDRFGLEGAHRDAVADMLSSSLVEVNCFGGNPELHPELLDLFSGLSRYQVNLTTTGGIFMRDSSFADRLENNPPARIALSADDFLGTDHIMALSAMSQEELKRARNKIPAVFGQQRKAHEAVYVAKLAQERYQFPQILFNLVVHEGNIGVIEDVIATLRDQFPGVVVNPYPAQSSFDHSAPAVREEHLGHLEAFIDRRISEQVSKAPGIVPRLHYWLMLKSVFHAQAGRPDKIIRSLSGYDTWRCYKQAGAGRYVQVGAFPVVHAGDKIPGGHLNCFWNADTLGSDFQVWSEGVGSGEVIGFINGGMGQNAQEAIHPCPGCLMPRLTFDMVSTELGMNEEFIAPYLALRKQYAGF